MAARRFAPVGWYCVRVDHVTRATRARPPVLTIRDRSWAYCRSGVLEDDHFWVPTRGVPLHELYRDPSKQAEPRSSLDWIDALRDELRETIGYASCVIEIARIPTPLRIAFDEPQPGEAPSRATVEVDLADAHGTVGRVSLTDDTRERFSEQEVELLRALVAPFAEPIRVWLRSPTGAT